MYLVCTAVHIFAFTLDPQPTDLRPTWEERDNAKQARPWLEVFQ